MLDMSVSRNWEETQRQQPANHTAEPHRHFSQHHVIEKEALWDKFAEEIWKQEWEVADGPDLKPGCAKDVSILLKIGDSRQKSREGEPQKNGLAFGNCQRESLHEDSDHEIDSNRHSKKAGYLKEQRQKLSFQSCRSERQMASLRESDRSVVISQELSCRSTSWQRSQPMDDSTQIEKAPELSSFHSRSSDWEGFLPEDVVLRAARDHGESAKILSSHGMRQERRKVKRSGGTKRQGDDLMAAPIATQGTTQLEHRIDMIAGASPTFHANSRSVPSKHAPGIVNASSYRMPVEAGINSSTSALYRSYMSTAPNDLSLHTFDTTSNFPASGNRSSIFSLIGGVPGLDEDSMGEWAMDEIGSGFFDMDDPCHPHKKVHKPFTPDNGGKVNKPTKKPNRGPGQRPVSSTTASFFPPNQHPGMPYAATKITTIGNPDDLGRMNDEAPGDASMDARGKKEDPSTPPVSKYANAPGKERQRRTAPLERWSSGCVSRSSRPVSRTSTGRMDPATGMHQPNPSLSRSSPKNMIDRIDNQGRCPLHVAVMADRPDVVNVLLEHDCDALKVLPIDLQSIPHGQHALIDGFPTTSMPRLPNSDPRRRHPYRQTNDLKTAPESLKGKANVHRHRGETGWWSIGMLKCTTGWIERPAYIDRLSLKLCNALHLAAYFGHLAILDILLSNTNIDPAAQNEHGCTALHLAANNGHAKIVARLLEHPRCCSDTTDSIELSPLHHAAAKGRSNVINVLWPKGCKIDATDIMGWTALHYAAQAGHVEAVGNLIIAGCPVSKYDKNGLTPGHLAAFEGYSDVLQKLLHAGFYHDLPGGAGAQHSGGGITALHLAASRGHVDVISQLLAEGANIHKEDHRGLNPLQCAAEGGHLEAFNILLEAGCNPKKADTLGTTLLHSAATGGNWDIVRKLLDLDCDPSVRTSLGKTLLHNAAQVGALKVTDNLLRLGCDIHVQDQDDNMPWHAAAEGGNLEVLEMFLSRGCDIEAKNRFGMTALHCAASSGCLPIVKALIDRGAVLRAVNENSQTALHIAAERGHEDVLIALIERVDIDVINARDVTQMTILHHVCEGRALKALGSLFERKADVNAPNNFGQTPLHLATMHHLKSTVEALLDHCCNISFKDTDAQETDISDRDRKGHGLLHYAVEGGDREIVEKLLSRGAAQYDLSSSDVMDALHLACELGHVAVASCLISAGYNIRGKGPDGLEPIHFASGARKREPVRFSSSSRRKQRIEWTHDDPVHEWTKEESEQHHKIVSILVEENADVHVVDNCGCNALMYAAGVGDLDLVMKYLHLNVDPARLDAKDCTSMHWAARSGSDVIIDQLINVGVPVASANKDGRLPLHEAAKRGRLAAVCAFVDVMSEKNMDIHKEDAHGKTPVQLAAAYGFADVVTKLLEGAKEKEVKGMTGLHLAIQMRLDDIVKSLLESGSCDVNARDNDEYTPLHYAAESGQSENVELLLQYKADLSITNAEGLMPIHRAATEGHLDAVDRLIEHGALRNHMSLSGCTPLHFAASAGHIDVMKRLISKGVQVDHLSSGSSASTALYSASSGGNLDAVNLLLDHKAEVDTVCANECTALHVASIYGHAAIVRRLVDAGAEVDFQAANSIAAVHNAVNNGHYEATEALIIAECDVDLQNSSGNTPLHLAACKGRVPVGAPRRCGLREMRVGSVELARLVLNANCDIHIRNLKGHQAIHSAASNGSFDVVLLLVQHGAPWRQKGDLDVAKMLCRKTNLMASYVDGRLRMAERAKHRKAKTMESSESVPTEEEMRQKQAQADAVMAELLAEEEKEKQQGDQKQKGKRHRDRKKKKDSAISEPRKEEQKKAGEKVASCSTLPDFEHATSAYEHEVDKSENEDNVMDALPRVIVRESSLRREEEVPQPAALFTEVRTRAAGTRQRKREMQSKQKRNRQPAPRHDPSPKTEPVWTTPTPNATRRSPIPSTAERKKKEEVSPPPPPPKVSGNSVTVIRRRQATTPIMTAPLNEMKKPQIAVRDVVREQTTAKANGTKRSNASTLARSVSVPESKIVEKWSLRQAANRSLTMAAVVAGSAGPKMKLPSANSEFDSVPKEEPPVIKKSESSHIWADAVKSTMEKKSAEVKIDTPKSGQQSRKKTVKCSKDSDIKVVNVSSNKKAFLPFTEGATVIDRPMPIATGSTVEETAGIKGTGDAAAEDKDVPEEKEEKPGKDSVLKWVTKDLSPTASSQQTDLKGIRVSPLTQKMKKLGIDCRKEEQQITKSDDASEEKSTVKSSQPNPWSIAPPHRPPPSSEAPMKTMSLDLSGKIDSPWKSVSKDVVWTPKTDPASFPPLAPTRSVSVVETIHSLPVPATAAFPFPGGSIDWGSQNFDLYSPPPPPPPPKDGMVTSHSWDQTITGSSATTTAVVTDNEAPSRQGITEPVFDDVAAAFGDPSSVVYHQMEQMDPNSLLPPELKDEITNGGATSVHFRTKTALSSNRGSPTPIHSPGSKLISYAVCSQGSPAWTKNVQGPFLPERINVPPPPPPPPVLSQSSAIISRIPDDPWEIDEVDVTQLKIPEVAQPPPPDIHPYEERVPYFCPLSRRPITDPVVASDGYTYDRSSIQGSHAYYHYGTYSNGYLL